MHNRKRWTGATLLLTAALALLSPAEGSSSTFYMKGDTATGTVMDCASTDDEPYIKIFEGASNNTSSTHMTFKNKSMHDMTQMYIRSSGWDRFPPDTNDTIHSFNVYGSWEVCEDINYNGYCQVFGSAYQKLSSSDLPQLSGKISSFRPVGCHDDTTATITMQTQGLRKPSNQRDQTAECLNEDDSGDIANNGKVALYWQDGRLSLTANKTGDQLWKSAASAPKVCFNSEGNLVLTDLSGTVIVWKKGGSQAGSQLVLDSSCNLKITKGGTTHWETGTSCP